MSRYTTGTPDRKRIRTAADRPFKCTKFGQKGHRVSEYEREKWIPIAKDWTATLKKSTILARKSAKSTIKFEDQADKELLK